MSDCQYDKWVNELMELQKKYPDIAKDCIYSEDFDILEETTSGFNLNYSRPEIVNKALYLMTLHNKKLGGK